MNRRRSSHALQTAKNKCQRSGGRARFGTRTRAPSFTRSLALLPLACGGASGAWRSPCPFCQRSSALCLASARAPLSVSVLFGRSTRFSLPLSPNIESQFYRSQPSTRALRPKCQSLWRRFSASSLASASFASSWRGLSSRTETNAVRLALALDSLRRFIHLAASAFSLTIEAQ